MMKKLLIFSTICLMIYIAYKVQQTNVPEGFSDPGKFKIFSCFVQLNNFILSTCTRFGIITFTSERRTSMILYGAQNFIFKNSDEWVDTTWDDTRVRIYNNDKIKENGPAFVYIHGGGWVSGSAAVYNHVVTKLFQRLQFFTVSIDYKMSPEYKYPGPENDCEAAIIYLMKNAKKFKIDPTRIIVAGDSAGGHLTMQMAHRFLDRRDNLPSLRAIIPVYPVVQPYVLSGPSYQINENDTVLPTHHVEKYWSLYLTGSIAWHKVFKNGLQTECSVLKDLIESKILDYNFSEKFDYKKNIQGFLEIKNCQHDKDFWEKYGEIMQDEDFSILLRNFEGYPPTLVVTMQYDVLRDDGFLLLKRLEKDGVNVVHYHDGSGFHGLLNTIDAFNENRRLIESIVQFVKKNS